MFIVQQFKSPAEEEREAWQMEATVFRSEARRNGFSSPLL
jgi:hypothetical protein